MNKNTLMLLGLLAAAPACAVDAQDAADVSSEAISSSKLRKISFQTNEKFQVTTWEKDAQTGEIEPVKVDAYYRITFLAPGKKGVDYQFEGHGAMAHEVIIEQVLANGKKLSLDSTFYAKSSANGKFQVFDCDSTRVCGAEHPGRATLAVIANGASVHLGGLGFGDHAAPDAIALEGVNQAELTLLRVR